MSLVYICIRTYVCKSVECKKVGVNCVRNVNFFALYRILKMTFAYIAVYICTYLEYLSGTCMAMYTGIGSN